MNKLLLSRKMKEKHFFPSYCSLNLNGLCGRHERCMYDEENNVKF